MRYEAMLASHVGGWEAALVLLILAYVFYRLDKNKIAKILHMILRLMYIIIVVFGAMLLFKFYLSDIRFIIKGLLGVCTIGLMEMALVRADKHKPNFIFFVGSLVLLVIVVLIGYRVI
ncbi:YisL family protein [Brevibacillus sp. 7WMA2]|uniref:DUF1516 family protein n=3 Tax=Brevibacillus TaxID=55080 RepID=A0A075QYQ4_BRELA|nr:MULTISPECIES: DUF1516 family protein [Brevibacillus]HAS00381.1 hypothetical protein [Brevibacillus sp.]AIG24734.1 hypothetical protein BRLA_c003390 [Brevibacillus laterosporus LMG 15441]AKF94289.1 hypothetical protein EX87_12085 [Brevibacillus laterosporus]AUM63384.1 hypothetical protein C0R09_01785 [Brevibacillus laterosporus]AYK06392.1 DUF1516 family protein [Brevibacillus laterosporus]